MRKSQTNHVKKICGCRKWKECEHPWYVSFRFGREIGPRGKARERGIRCKLSPLTGREPDSFVRAQSDAVHVIVNWLDDQARPFVVAADRMRKLGSKL